LAGPNGDRLAAALGDPVAHRGERLTFIRDLLDDDSSDLKREALAALADVGSDDLPRRLSQALQQRPFSELTWEALRLVGETQGPDWASEVYSLFCSLRPDGNSALWEKCVGFLLRRGQRVAEMLAALPQAGTNARAEAALLGLEHGSGDPTPLFRRALAGDTSPSDRGIAAAALVLLDSPWGRSILLAALGESSDWAATQECRAALRECQAPSMREAVEAWEETNGPSPDRPALDPERWLRFKMEQLHDRVLPLRGRAPRGP
jgi:hypothetical protein